MSLASSLFREAEARMGNHILGMLERGAEDVVVVRGRRPHGRLLMAWTRGCGAGARRREWSIAEGSGRPGLDLGDVAWGHAVIAIRRGFIASGISRWRLMISRPFSNRAPLTSTWSAPAVSITSRTPAILCRGFESKLSPTMRQTHAAGERLFVDYAGDGVPVVIDRLTGEIRKAQIFVAVLGASSFTLAHAGWTQAGLDRRPCPRTGTECIALIMLG